MNGDIHGVMLADTHDIGGYKVGVGFALRKCRVCLSSVCNKGTVIKELSIIIVSILFSSVICTERSHDCHRLKAMELIRCHHVA